MFETEHEADAEVELGRSRNERDIRVQTEWMCGKKRSNANDADIVSPVWCRCEGLSMQVALAEAHDGGSLLRRQSIALDFVLCLSGQLCRLWRVRLRIWW